MPMIVAPPVLIPAVQDAEPAVKPFEEVAEWLEPVRAMLTTRYGADKMPQVDALLLETGAVIAGGSILRAVSPWDTAPLGGNNQVKSPEVNDLDIYVPVRNAPRLIDGLYTGEGSLVGDVTNYKVLPASSYCESFLRKNGIRRVYTFLNSETRAPTDIMSVRHRRTVQQVVTNFDLTICQIWYDGAKVYASHPQDIRDKKATLQSDYVLALVRGNRFIRKRIEKYMKRGFAIAMEGTAEHAQVLPSDLNACRDGKTNTFRRRGKNPEFWTRWYASVVTAWLTGTYTTFVKADCLLDIPDSPIPKANLLVPLVQNRSFISKESETGLHIVTKESYSWVQLIISAFWDNCQDTGYDSEDYENVDNRRELARRITSPDIPDITGEHALSLNMNTFLQYQLLPIEYSIVREDYNARTKPTHHGVTLGTFIYKDKRLLPLKALRSSYYLSSLYMRSDVIEKYASELIIKSLRVTATPLQFAETGATVYDIHDHPAEAGISTLKLKDYLRRYSKFPKESLPCYWKGCTKKLVLSEIHLILGPEDYIQWKESDSVESSKLWRGFTKADVSIMDTIFSTEGKKAADFSCCPVCLSYAERRDGCMYMHHKCPDLDTVYSKDLYTKYQDQWGNLWWCTLCGRACVHDPLTGHYALTHATDPKADIIPPGPGADPFSNDCTPYGGGMLLEKFIRFQAIRDVAMALKDLTGRLTVDEVKLMMIEAAWNAPLEITPERKAELQTLLAEKRFAVPTSAFPNRPANLPATETANNNNNLVYPNIPYPNGNIVDPLLPDFPLLPEVLFEADDATTLETARPALQFKHRRKDGTVNLHEDEYIGVKNFFDLLKQQNVGYKDERFGMCWNFPDCDARIYPQEVLHILTILNTMADQYPEVTAEEKAQYQEIYEDYKNKFNRKFYQRGGTRRHGRGHRHGHRQRGGDNGIANIPINADADATPFFVEATDAQCMLPPRATVAAVAPRRRTLRKKRSTRRR